MHRHIEWEDPAKTAYPNCLLTTTMNTPAFTRNVIRWLQGHVTLHVKVEAYREEDAVSIGGVCRHHGHQRPPSGGAPDLDVGGVAPR